MGSSIKENLFAVITSNVPKLLIVGATVLAVFLVWKIAKKFVFFEKDPVAHYDGRPDSEYESVGTESDG